jgi:Uma2 family endonuclease
VLLDDTTCLQPDLVVVRSSRPGLIKEHAIVGVPDLVVEILSPSHPGNDRFLKRGVYARFGIPEYWIIEPTNGFVTVLRSSAPGKYDLEARFDRSSTLTSEEFPELSVPLPKVFK